MTRLSIKRDALTLTFLDVTVGYTRAPQASRFVFWAEGLKGLLGAAKIIWRVRALAVDQRYEVLKELMRGEIRRRAIEKDGTPILVDEADGGFVIRQPYPGGTARE